MRILIIFLITTFLCSCAQQPPTAFGLTTSQWESLSTAEQQATISNYKIHTQTYATAPKITMKNETANYTNQLSTQNPIEAGKAKPITLTQAPQTATTLKKNDSKQNADGLTRH